MANKKVNNKEDFIEIKTEIENFFNSRVVKINKLEGVNNICLYVKLEEGKELFVKKYVRDEEKRLEREYGTISFLTKKKNNPHIRTAKPYFLDKENYFAVYSFIHGNFKKTIDIKKKEIDDLTNYFIAIHSIRPSKKNRQIYKMRSLRSVDSLSDNLRNLDFKMGCFYEYYNDLPKTNNLRKKIDSLGYLSRFNYLEKQIKKTISPIDLNKKINQDDLRINHIDFGLHNMFFFQGKPYFFDYEKSGWGDPYRMVGDLMVHDRNIKIPSNLRQLFLEKYQQKRKLSLEEKTRCNNTIKLMDIEWIGTYLRAITPEKIEINKKTIKNFNHEKRVNTILKRVGKRLTKIEQENYF